MALSEFPRMGFDPFAELRRMQSEMNRLFAGYGFATARDFPPVNIWLGNNSVVVTAENAGRDPQRRHSQFARRRVDARGQERANAAGKRQLAASRESLWQFLACGPAAFPG